MRFLLYCTKCQKFDVDCLFCSATSVYCVRHSDFANVAWCTSEVENEFFGNVTPPHYNKLSGKDREELDVSYILREMLEQEYEKVHMDSCGDVHDEGGQA